MARLKIDYGIDLGTTNSAIARMENGEPVIIKTDTLKDTLPSCVSINKKGSLRAGDAAFNALKFDKIRAAKSDGSFNSNAFIEFKRTMGTDKVYQSTYLDKGFTSEELSAELLKSMKTFVTDEVVHAAVITVPAKFTIAQKDATANAAELAGFKYCELLQEPIAASFAYGLKPTKKDGYWAVFDFGGGTFDAALLKVDEGIVKVIDTEGDNWLGGKNLDYAIVDEIIIPYLKENFDIEDRVTDVVKLERLRDAMKVFAEEIKIQLSFKESADILSDIGELGQDDSGDEMELELTVHLSDLEQVVSPIFQKAIDILKNLLSRNNISNESIDSLILVGGPTYSPILRRMLAEQIVEPDTSIDPMTAVAKGAALYASTISISEEIRDEGRDKSKIQIDLGYESTSIEEIEMVTAKLNKGKSEGDLPKELFIEFFQGDRSWSSGKTKIDEFGEVIELHLKKDSVNVFHLKGFDENGNLVGVEPEQFTIINGTKPGSETLSYHVGIQVRNSANQRLVFRSVLAKNQSTPITGVIRDNLKTQKDIRPGVREDEIKIPIYQGEYGADGTRAEFNYHVTDIKINGTDVVEFLPSGSEVEITLKHDRGNNLSFSAYFPVIDYSHELEKVNIKSTGISAEKLNEMISNGISSLNLMKEDGQLHDQDEINEVIEDLNQCSALLDQGSGDYDRREQVFDNLKRFLIKIDELIDKAEWPKTEDELKDAFHRLEESNNEFNNPQVAQVIAQLKGQIPTVIKERNVALAQDIIKTIRQLEFALIDEGLGAQLEISLLHQFNDNFASHDWNDSTKARMLINQGLSLASSNPSKQKLRPIVIEIYKLLPKVDQPIIDGDGSELIG